MAAARLPDPASADLTRYAYGDALDVMVGGLTQMRRHGLVGQGEVTLMPRVTAAEPAATPPTVTIEDCVDTAHSRLVVRDGSAYQDTPGGRRSATATVTRQTTGVWKVSAFALFAVGSC